MPEYLAPGVYVEETSFRSKSIEGVSTTTTGFVGPTRYGPLDIEPDVLTSLLDFERTYGDGQELVFDGGIRAPNHMWHAARAFFNEGGKRLYVSRVFVFREGSAPGGGYGTWARRPDHDTSGDLSAGLSIRSRFPGTAGNFVVEVTLRARANALGQLIDPASGVLRSTVEGLNDRDVVWIRDVTTSPPGSPPLTVPAGSPGQEGDFFLALRDGAGGTWKFRRLITTGGPPAAPDEKTIEDLVASAEPGRGASVRPLMVTVRVFSPLTGEEVGLWEDMALDPEHKSNGFPDSLLAVFVEHPDSLALARSLPIVVVAGKEVADGFDVLRALFGPDPEVPLRPTPAQAARGIGRDELLTRGLVVVRLWLDHGDDGKKPGALGYEGRVDPTTDARTGLKQLEDIEDISIVAAPGVTWRYADYRDDANAVMHELIGHAERMRYRIAILDSAEGQSVADVRNMRSKMDSKHAALYYPWVKILDPITRKQINLPPSGF